MPGAVDGWFELHGRFGRLPMIEILRPTINYARNGHPVHETIAHYWEISAVRLAEWPGFTEQMTIDGRAPGVGEHTDELLSALGLTAEELATLRERGAIR